jgi:ParB family transcriptional regulator, chromosome partitioning protein
MERPVNRRLGRGLASLMSNTSAPSDTPALPPDIAAVASALAPKPDNRAPQWATEVIPREIALDWIRPNPYQPRRVFNEASLRELADSLIKTGMIQPIVVCKVADHYELVAGERRLRAAKLANLSHVPVLIRPSLDPVRQAQMALIENIQREDLNPMDRAEAYETLIRQLGLSQAELAERLGEERTSVANYLRLLDLCQPVRQLVRDGRLPVGHAKVLAGVADVAEQERLANLAVEQDLTVRNLERLLQAPPKPEPPAAAPPASAHLQDLEKNLARHLGMRVQVRTTRGSKTRGRVVIHYGDLDQFDQLLTRLGVQLDA